MNEMTRIGTFNSFTATNSNGDKVHFSVLPVPGLDTEKEAKAIARKQKLGRVKFFTFVGL